MIYTTTVDIMQCDLSGIRYVLSRTLYPERKYVISEAIRIKSGNAAHR
jgi:hypothetical protein